MSHARLGLTSHGAKALALSSPWGRFEDMDENRSQWDLAKKVGRDWPDKGVLIFARAQG